MLLEQQTGDLSLLPVNDHFSMDVKRRCSQIAPCPFLDLGSCLRVSADIDFYVIDVVLRQPDAGSAAARAPLIAKQHHPIQLQLIFLSLFIIGNSRLNFGLDAFDLLKKDLITGLVINVMDVDVADDPLFIDDDDCPFRITVRFPEHVVFFDHLAVGPEVTQEWKRNAAYVFRPGFQNGDVINADAQNLDI